MSDQTQDQVTPAIEPLSPKANLGTDKTGLRDSIVAAVKTVREKEAAKAKPAETPDATPAKVEGRDDKGKFTPKAKDTAETPVVKDASKPLEAATPEAGGQKTIAAPGTWKPEARAAWATIPDQAKGEILRREAESAREVTKYQNELKAVRNEFDEIDAVISNRKGFLKAQYGSVGRGINELFRLSDWAGSNPGEFAQWLFQQTGFNPQTGTQQPADPRYAKLEQTVTGLQATLQQQLAQQQDQATRSVSTQIEAFVGATGQDGSLLRPHFEAVREHVFHLIPGLQQVYPNASVEQILDKAYQAAIRTNDALAPDIQRHDEERLRAQLEAQQRVAKAVVANKSITGTNPANDGVSGLKDDPKDLQATLRRNYRKFMNGGEARI